MLSIVTCARVDNYQGDFVGRFVKSVDNNCLLFKEVGLEYEYIAVEWNPSELLFADNRTSRFFDEYNFKSVIVSSDAIDKRGFNPNKVQEYYSKNVGIRHAGHQNVFILNSDIVLTIQAAQKIADLVKSGLTDNYYRFVNRVQSCPNTLNRMYCTYLINPSWPDNHVIAAYSGDTLLAKKSVLVDVAQGYDESNDGHKGGFQTAMDGEICFQLYNKGIKPIALTEEYLHLFHDKDRIYDSTAYQQKGYENVINWGFNDFPKTEVVKNKVWVI